MVSVLTETLEILLFQSITLGLFVLEFLYQICRSKKLKLWVTSHQHSSGMLKVRQTDITVTN